ncbi:MAG: ATP-binding protein [Actinomyces sp.]|nr:ATP-binding protein [Actinomyces sp.]
MSVGGRHVVVAEVDGLPLADRPCRYRKRAYLRQADGDYAMSDQEVAQIELLKATHRPRHDSQVVEGSGVDDLDADLARSFVEEAGASSRRLAGLDAETVLARKGVVDPTSGDLTLAGVYGLGVYPTQFEPSLTITAVAEDPSDPTVRNLDKQVFDGPLPDLLEDAVAWVMRNTRTSVRFGADGHGYDTREIPAVAVREIIANALVHRDLSPVTIGKDVQIRLTSDRLVVTNPGGLWGVSADQLGQAKSAVNVVLYDMCKLLRTRGGARVIEGEGGGIKAVQQSLRDVGLPTARFIDRGVSFTVILPRHAVIAQVDQEWLGDLPGHGELSPVQQQILVAMRHGGTWTNQLVRQEFAPMDSTQARALLADLVDRGLAARTSSGRGTTYGAPDLIEGAVANPARVESSGPAVAQASSRAEGALGLPRNADVVMDALRGGHGTRGEIAAATSLTDAQVRYALAGLRDAGLVQLVGGQGTRTSSYIVVAR